MFEFKIDQPNPLQTVLGIEKLQDQRLRRDEYIQKLRDRDVVRANAMGALQGDTSSTARLASISPELALKMTEAYSKLDERKRARLKDGLELSAKAAQASRDMPTWNANYQSLIDQGFPEFASEIGKFDEGRRAANIQRALDVQKLFELSPEAGAMKADQEFQKQSAVQPLALQRAAAGRTSVRVEMNPPQQPVPKIDPATGKIIGFEMPEPVPKQGRARSAGAAGGPKDPSGLAQPTINDLEEKQVKTFDAINRTEAILSGYRPEFLQLGPRWINRAVSFGDKTGLYKPNAQEQSQLEEFTRFRRDAVDSVNKGITEATGATMGVQEASRLMAAMPDPGTGLFDGDGPIEFKAKADASLSALKNAQIRYHWARHHGLSPLRTGVDLADVPALVNQRGSQLENEVRAKNPGWGDREIKQAVRRQLGVEFGLNR